MKLEAKQRLLADSVEKKIASLEKKIQSKQDAIGLARERRRAKGDRQQGPREMKLAKEVSDLQSEIHRLRNPK